MTAAVLLAGVGLGVVCAVVAVLWATEHDRNPVQISPLDQPLGRAVGLFDPSQTVDNDRA